MTDSSYRSYETEKPPADALRSRRTGRPGRAHACSPPAGAAPHPRPTHFGLAGHPNAYGPKSSLLLLPGVGVLLYLLLTAVGRIPWAMNLPYAHTERERGKAEAMARTTVSLLKAELIWTFVFLEWTAISIALGRSHGLNGAFTPVSLSLVCATICIYYVRMRRLRA